MELSQETLAILGVGAGLLVGLGGLQLSLHASLSGRIDRLEVRMDSMTTELADVRERLARVETRLAIPAAADAAVAATTTATPNT
ncbi:MAG: hypothetical protein OXE03_06195 [Gammaproteobacteria bacterium]|nr:hypothetical protein [Gammaproteobacteria bacterium]